MIKNKKTISSLKQLAKYADYSYLNSLTSDHQTKDDGFDHEPREVCRGHYIKVTPTPIKDPIYITHSKKFFKELGLDDSLAVDEEFKKMFSADSSTLPKPLKNYGWATGYALSIYGTEYYDQCIFKTGNGYGDGRAISIFEGVLNNKRWEMQLKGAGKTAYCRGADGRAVLRSSIREFLAQEYMDALGVPTSRSLTLYTSQTQKVKRAWFNKNSYSKDPEIMIDEPVAICTRVAPSFIRVGQLELFARRTRKQEHDDAKKELKQLVLHLIKREYKEIIDENLHFEQKVLLLAKEFSNKLSSLVANWIRVGYCQGNFNSDNCAAGGFTLDYGPFGFIEMFDPRFQPWTGGGVHFSFFNQPQAAKKNFDMFCKSLKPLFDKKSDTLQKLKNIQDNFTNIMTNKIETMWASKLGLKKFDENLFNELIALMLQTGVDYTIFFRELSFIPNDITPLTKSFYSPSSHYEKLLLKWEQWYKKYRSILSRSDQSIENISKQMKQTNPKYTLREWFLVEAYEKALDGDYKELRNLQEVMLNPYLEQSKDIEQKYYRKKPIEFFDMAGISHMSCSS